MIGRDGNGEGRITPQVLLKAYSVGLFPMAEDAGDPTLYWVEPEMRGIIPLDRFHDRAEEAPGYCRNHDLFERLKHDIEAEKLQHA